MAAILPLSLGCAAAYGQTAEERAEKIVRDIQDLKNRQQPPPDTPAEGPSAADRARAAAREARRQSRAIAAEHYSQAIDARNRGEWARAAAQFRIAYQHDPKSAGLLDDLVEATRQVGLLAMARGDWDQAATNFQSALYHRPDSEEFRRLLAGARQKLLEQARIADSRRAAARANEEGRVLAASGDWAGAAAYFKSALQSNPSEPAYLENLVLARNTLGDEAKVAGNYAAALAYFRSALEADPASGYATRNVASLQMLLRDKAAAATARSSVEELAGGLKGERPGAGLGYGDLPLTPFTPNPPASPMKSAEPHSPGTNVAAGDQLLCASKTSTAGGDLTENYDVGGAACTGSLGSPGTRSRASAQEMAGFSEQARNDPQVIALAGKIAALRDKGDQLETERAQLETRRNLATVRSTMDALSAEVTRKEQEYQVNLTAIANQREAVQRRRRIVDNKVADTPAPDPPTPPR